VFRIETRIIILTLGEIANQNAIKGLIPVHGSGLLFCQIALLDGRDWQGQVKEMHGRRAWVTGWIAVLGLLGGVGAGLFIGWGVAPVEYVDTNLSYLHPVYKQEFILMVSEAYALDGDLDVAQARLALLTLPTGRAAAVAELAEEAIAQQWPAQQIGDLARLASALGAQNDALTPYLSLPDSRSMEQAP